MVDRESEARGFIASALPNEAPSPGHIYPASVSDVEGSGEVSTAGFTALPVDSPLTSDAQMTGTSTSTKHVCKHPGPGQDPLATAQNYRQPEGAVMPHSPETTLLPNSEVSKAKTGPMGHSVGSELPVSHAADNARAARCRARFVLRSQSQGLSERSRGSGQPEETNHFRE